MDLQYHFDETNHYSGLAINTAYRMSSNGGLTSLLPTDKYSMPIGTSVSNLSSYFYFTIPEVLGEGAVITAECDLKYLSGTGLPGISIDIFDAKYTGEQTTSQGIVTKAYDRLLNADATYDYQHVRATACTDVSRKMARVLVGYWGANVGTGAFRNLRITVKNAQGIRRYYTESSKHDAHNIGVAWNQYFSDTAPVSTITYDATNSYVNIKGAAKESAFIRYFNRSIDGGGLLPVNPLDKIKLNVEGVINSGIPCMSIEFYNASRQKLVDYRYFMNPVTSVTPTDIVATSEIMVPNNPSIAYVMIAIGKTNQDDLALDMNITGVQVVHEQVKYTATHDTSASSIGCVISTTAVGVPILDDSLYSGLAISRYASYGVKNITTYTDHISIIVSTPYMPRPILSALVNTPTLANVYYATAFSLSASEIQVYLYTRTDNKIVNVSAWPANLVLSVTGII